MSSSASSPAVPTLALQKFLHYIRERKWERAKALAFEILTDDKDNQTVWAALPLINKQIEAAAEEKEEEEEDDGEEKRDG